MSILKSIRFWRPVRRKGGREFRPVSETEEGIVSGVTGVRWMRIWTQPQETTLYQTFPEYETASTW